MTNILVCLYPQYADFQIGHLLFFLKKDGNAKITTVSIDGANVESLGGLVVKPNLALSKVNPREFDLVLLPGGDSIHEVVNDSGLHSLLREFHKEEIPIASICGSATILAKAGILDDQKFTSNPHTYEHYNEAFSNAEYTGSNVEIANGFITAKGAAFADFTVAVGNQLGMWRNKEHADKAYAFCTGNI